MPGGFDGVRMTGALSFFSVDPASFVDGVPGASL
jgi:hypothetical protein